jgi:hypothetical protein
MAGDLPEPGLATASLAIFCKRTLRRSKLVTIANDDRESECLHNLLLAAGYVLRANKTYAFRNIYTIYMDIFVNSNPLFYNLSRLRCSMYVTAVNWDIMYNRPERLYKGERFFNG